MTATLTTILGERPAQSIDEVIAMMTAIDETLPDSDGVKSFNRPLPELKNKFFSQLHSFTGFAGRGLLTHNAIAKTG